jgi:L-asparagine oxygenase
MEPSPMPILLSPVYPLSPQERQGLAELASEVTGDPVDDPERFCRQARSAARRLPDGLIEMLWRFADTGSPGGTAVVRNAEVGTVPDTPPDNRRGVGSRTRLARQQAILGHALGEMVAYEAESRGHLLQDMVPNRDLAYAQQSQGSRVELEAHTEQCFSDLRPDYVTLGCLRGDPHAVTYSFAAKALVSHLDRCQIAELRKPLWTTAVDASFTVDLDRDEVRGPFPILSGDPDDPVMLVDRDLMHGTTASSRATLLELIRIYVRHRHAHVLQAGDILLLDNLRAMHGRSAFAPRFDGRDRFVTRGFVVRDLRRSRFARPGNVRQIASAYS